MGLMSNLLMRQNKLIFLHLGIIITHPRSRQSFGRYCFCLHAVVVAQREVHFLLNELRQPLRS